MQVHEALPGDMLLLCSDGLTTMVPDPEIQRLLIENGGVEPAAKALIDDANKNGGEDNITVILLQFVE
jgi:protein phosphatase